MCCRTGCGLSIVSLDQDYGERRRWKLFRPCRRANRDYELPIACLESYAMPGQLLCPVGSVVQQPDLATSSRKKRREKAANSSGPHDCYGTEGTVLLFHSFTHCSRRLYACA